MSAEEGAKAATSFAYFEPSGLLQSTTLPGPSGSGATTVTVSTTYDTLGNPLSVTGPGNNAASSITTTLNYTTDGGYSQGAAIGQPLTITDNLGHVTHLRYDSRANATSQTDALGNQWSATWSLADDLLTFVEPATGQTGTGNCYGSLVYL